MTETGYVRADSVLGVETPEGVEFVLSPAGPLVRACAFAIDVAIQQIIQLGLVFAVLRLFWDEGGYWIYLLFCFLIDWFYHSFWDLCFRGQSPGKKIMGIRVVRNDGSPVSPGASFLRNLLRFADTFMCLCPIALICMAASRGFRRIGDWAAGTLVVYTSHSLALPPRRPGGRSLSDEWFQDLSPVFPPRPLSGEEKQAVVAFARRYPLLGQARADEIAGPFADFLKKSAETPAGEAGISPAVYLLGIARKAAGGIL
jgi:uncharacterized RDD family membrane protein YckC